MEVKWASRRWLIPSDNCDLNSWLPENYFARRKISSQTFVKFFLTDSTNKLLCCAVAQKFTVATEILQCLFWKEVLRVTILHSCQIMGTKWHALSLLFLFWYILQIIGVSDISILNNLQKNMGKKITVSAGYRRLLWLVTVYVCLIKKTGTDRIRPM